MRTSVDVKICGLTQQDTLMAAVEAGARYLGFTFVEKSSRAITPAQASALMMDVPPGVMKVGLVVNPADDELDAILSCAPLDMIQLHGSEDVARVSAIKSRTGLPVMKAIGVGGRDDLPKIAQYGAVADYLLVDAKPASNSELPGGNGVAFDWKLIAEIDWPTPWMLAGGLTSANVGRAIRETQAQIVDVSSGVESAPGVKDVLAIQEFISAATL